MSKIWANALLSDGQILFWYTGSECGQPIDFYKDFYYAGINMTEYESTHKLELAKKKFTENIDGDNRKIFEELAPDFYRQYKISPDSKGVRPYKVDKTRRS